MDLIPSPPFVAGSIAWHEQPGRWTLTVVCKATYSLEPGTAPIAPEPEDINEHDNHWDDDAQRSLYAPSDLVPFKPRPEVMIVGNAFTPRGEPVRRLFARVQVGELDKSIEVFVPRTLMADGTIREGPRWKQMPLRYERAAGGPESWNPVGVTADGVDRYGRRALPNLQPPGLHVTSGSDTILPVGFGPIAATWRVRREKLGRRGASWSDDRWSEEPLGEGFDGAYFQAAPLDQRVAELRADEPIVLENLHPAHARLVTRLPGVRPRARVEIDALPPWEIELVADTLWIDTNRSICTLTWRGRIPLGDRDQPGRVRIGIEEPGKPVRWAASLPPPRPSRAPDPDPEEDVDLQHTAVDDVLITRLPAPAPQRAVLPFRAADGRSAPIPAPVSRPAASSPADLAWHDPETGDETGQMRAHVPRSAAPSWLDLTPASSALPPPPEPSRPVAPPPPISMLLRPGEAAPIASVAALSDAAASAALPPPIAPAPAVRPPMESVNLGKVNEKALSSAAYAGLLEVSNAAAGGPEDAKPPPPRKPMPSEVPAAQVERARVLHELVWFDEHAASRIRLRPEWSPLTKKARPRTSVDDPGDDAKAVEERGRADRTSVAAVLARGTPVTDVEAAVLDAEGDGALEPVLCLVAGEIEMVFDEVETLKTLVAAAGTLAPGDKKLKEVIDLAGEVMKTPLGAAPEVAAGFVLRVRDAWTRATRALPADYLDTHTRRLLLDQRMYQKRQLANAEWIRALFAPQGVSSPIPAYLPVAMGRWLPLYAKFTARVIAEAVPQQDQHETSPVALRVLALSRVVSARSRAR